MLSVEQSVVTSEIEYDERAVLIEYVWKHCHTYMTNLERHGLKAVHAREKAAAAENERLRRMILEKWGGGADLQVTEALSRGEESFKRAVCDRVLRDHPEVINRCPNCGRVARTPKARQCRWCLHDWHQLPSQHVKPFSIVSEAVLYVDALQGTASELRLPITDVLQDELGLNMALILDHVLARGWLPDGYEQRDGYRIYRYKDAPP